MTWQNGRPVSNAKGKAHPKAAGVLPSLFSLLNRKLKAAGYPGAFLHTVEGARAQEAG